MHVIDGIPRYVPQYSNKYSGIPWYKIIGGTQHKKGTLTNVVKRRRNTKTLDGRCKEMTSGQDS